jgi:hypothetical protein
VKTGDSGNGRIQGREIVSTEMMHVRDADRAQRHHHLLATTFEKVVEPLAG